MLFAYIHRYLCIDKCYVIAQREAERLIACAYQTSEPVENNEPTEERNSIQRRNGYTTAPSINKPVGLFVVWRTLRLQMQQSMKLTVELQAEWLLAPLSSSCRRGIYLTAEEKVRICDPTKNNMKSSNMMMRQIQHQALKKLNTIISTACMPILNYLFRSVRQIEKQRSRMHL